MTTNLVCHDIVNVDFKEIIYELRPCTDKNGQPIK